MNGFSRFVYFSYSAAGDGPAGFDRPGLFYCTGWGIAACDGSGGRTPDSGDLVSIFSLPAYSEHDTEQSVDRQVAVLDWLLGQVIRTDPDAQIDIIGFSLRWRRGDALGCPEQPVIYDRLTRARAGHDR